MTRPPFAYFGGKQGMADAIVDLLPPHRVYVEPYFGSGAVLFAKQPSRFEIVNDIDGALTTFWRVLRERTDELEMVCALTPHSRPEFAAATLDVPGLDEMEIARRFWTRVNQSFAKTAHPTSGWSITTARTQSVPASVLARIGRFAPAVERMANVSIECCDAVDLITRLANGDDHVIYADPPYLWSTRTKSGGNGYRHDMLDDAGHERLAAALHATSASVVLSGYPSPMYDALYAGWNRLDREVTAHSSNSRRSDRTGRVEHLWLNFEPAARAADPTLWEALR